MLHFCESFDVGYGGPATSVPMLVRDIGDEKATLVSFDEEKASNSLIKHNWVKLGSLTQVLKIQKFTNLLNQTNIVCVHTLWSPWLVLVFLCSLLRSQVSIIMFVRGSLLQNSIKKRVFYLLLLYPLLKRSEVIVCATAGQMKTEMPACLHQKVVIAPNHSPFSIDNDNNRKKLLKRREPKFMFCGRIHRHKRIEIALKLLKKLEKREITIIGRCDDAKYLAELEKLASELKITFNYIGLLEKNMLSCYYAAHDYLILSSKSENFGNVVIEAAMHGVVPLVSRNLYICEYLPSEICFDESELQFEEELFNTSIQKREKLIEDIMRRVDLARNGAILRLQDYKRLKQDMCE